MHRIAFFYIAMRLERFLLTGRIRKILEISMYNNSGCCYGRLALDCQKRVYGGEDTDVFVDRIDISEILKENTDTYSDILPLEALDHPELLDEYNVIIIADLLENLDEETAKSLISKLSERLSEKNGFIIIIALADVVTDAVFDSKGIVFNRQNIEAMPENLNIIKVTRGTSAGAVSK